MRFALLLGLLVLAVPSVAMAEPAAVTAWFTQAAISNGEQAAKPENALPDAPGTAGNGVLLARSVAIDNPLLRQTIGYLSFWIRPNWNGNDAKRHRILHIGDPRRNGLLVEKAATGMLRYVMASPQKTTAARADVSNWKAGEWHHMVIAWMDMNGNGKPMGLPLWIDKVAVDGPIAGGNEFLNPEKMTDKRVWIGDATSDAVMDELIIRNRWNTEQPVGQLPQVYRDYFRTAPYTKVKVDVDSGCAPADRRAIAGHEKQFGLIGEKDGKMEKMTDFTVRYWPWSEFDAKPFIKWTTSDEKVATVDENGLVTARSVGKCKLTAEYRGMKDAYDLEVIPIEQPDLDLAWVERLPRYRADRAKDRPEPGESVRSVAHIINFGYRPAPAGAVVRFELIPDENRNFRLDPMEKPITVEKETITKTLNPRDEETVTFGWTWTDEPLWVRVTVDPDNKVPELCEANNQRCELNTARALRFAYYQDDLDTCYNEKRINLVGSFSYMDYANALLFRLELIAREAVWPTTTPNGIEDSFRTDNFYVLTRGEDMQEEPFLLDDKYYDGGWQLYAPDLIMHLDSGIIHELGHSTFNLPDLYGYPVHKWAVLLKDEKGEYYAGGELMPVVNDAGVVTLTSAICTQCGEGYQPLMVSCHFWLNPAHAGQVQYYRGFRGLRLWWGEGHLLATRQHIFQVYDIDDKPLVGAALYIYHVAQTNAQSAATKYFYDRPNFTGNTDEDGRYYLPERTDPSWDDPETDEVDGAIYVWNPFGGVKRDTAFTPNVWTVDGLLLLKIVSGDQTEFRWMPVTELNEAFLSGEGVSAIYKIRTSLKPRPGVTPIVRPTIPDAIKVKNLQPVVVVPTELKVKCGQEFVMDASKSYDPEGQPLIYRWQRVSGSWTEPSFWTEPVWKGKAQNEPGDVEFRLYVIDGLRVSEPVTIKIKVEQ